MNRGKNGKTVSNKSPQKYKIGSRNSVRPSLTDDTELENKNVSEHLFFSQASKAKKSYVINTSEYRKIHVHHYAQHASDLYSETCEMSANYNTAIVLFFIHGVGGSADMWHPQTQYFLYQGYEIISIDLLGHGLSSKPHNYKSYQFIELANDVLIIFDRFAKKKNVVIGHSYGSSFCTLLAKERSSSISKMVLISGGGPTTLMPEKCSAFCLPYPMFYMLAPGVVKAFRRMAFHVKTHEEIKNKITTFGLSPFTLKAIMQGQHWGESDEEFHADLVVPVLLIYGRGDQFVTLDEEIWMNETIYGSQLEVIENAGHMVTIEAPQAVNNVIHAFLNRDASTSCNNTDNEPTVNSIPFDNKPAPMFPGNVTPDRFIESNGNDTPRGSCKMERSTSRMSQKSIRSGRRKTLC